MNPHGRADFLFLSELNVSMWDMYPRRFLTLLENLLTKGMTDEERKEWNDELCTVGPEIDASDPMLQAMLDMKQAATLQEAAELIRLGDQLHRTSNPDQEARIRKRMVEINTKAKEARAT